MKKIHFSVDDTFGCFNWLNQNNKSKSIFNSTTFNFAKNIYEKYGICTSFYCMFTDGKKTLDDIDLGMEKQFLECSDWMKFGFHCYDDKSNYNIATKEKIADDYVKVTNALVKITGGKVCLTDILRLHFFAGNNITVKYLREKGIRCLLCADDNRKSYNLSDDAEYKINSTGYYYDYQTGMKYVRTDLRVESIKDIKKDIDRIKQLPRDEVFIFTHERFLKIEEFKNYMKICFENLCFL